MSLNILNTVTHLWSVRTPLKGDDYFCRQVNAAFGKVEQAYLEAIKSSVAMREAGTVFKSMAGAADKALQAELEKKGYANLEFQDLFTKMFDDGSLVEELDKKATSVESEFPEFEEMRKKKAKLFSELNDLLIELYQTSPVLMDYNRLMQGEEGVTTYFDIEIIKNKKTKARAAYLNTQAISKEAADTVATELHKVAEALSRAAR